MTNYEYVIAKTSPDKKRLMKSKLALMGLNYSVWVNNKIDELLTT